MAHIVVFVGPHSHWRGRLHIGHNDKLFRKTNKQKINTQLNVLKIVVNRMQLSEETKRSQSQCLNAWCTHFTIWLLLSNPASAFICNSPLAHAMVMLGKCYRPDHIVFDDYFNGTFAVCRTFFLSPNNPSCCRSGKESSSAFARFDGRWILAIYSYTRIVNGRRPKWEVMYVRARHTRHMGGVKWSGWRGKAKINKK